MESQMEYTRNGVFYHIKLHVNNINTVHGTFCMFCIKYNKFSKMLENLLIAILFYSILFYSILFYPRCSSVCDVCGREDQQFSELTHHKQDLFSNTLLLGSICVHCRCLQQSHSDHSLLVSHLSFRLFICALHSKLSLCTKNLGRLWLAYTELQVDFTCCN